MTFLKQPAPPSPKQQRTRAMDNAWKRYAADFNAMSDEDIDEETARCRSEVNEAESWLEAVASWEAAGKPRKDPSNG